MQPNPILVDVTRGPLVESVHRGRIAIVGRSGGIVAAVGDIDKPTYPRSAIKALQAVAMVESGAADRFGLSDLELALVCSSHNGEAAHVAAARSILKKAGADETLFECGAQMPARPDDVAILNRSDANPLAVHNNCSGKHAGFIALARQLGVDPAGYVEKDHPVQQRVAGVLAEMTGAAHAVDACGTDGCSIPTYAIPLTDLARGFWRFVTGEGLTEERAEACRRLYGACVSHPFLVAGTERFCTGVMEIFSGRVFVKTGAEGVFVAAFRDLGMAVALKIDDGATRAAEVAMAEVIAALVPMSDAETRAFERFRQPVLRNRNDREVGRVQAVSNIFSELRAQLKA